MKSFAVFVFCVVLAMLSGCATTGSVTTLNYVYPDNAFTISTVIVTK